MLGFPPPLLTVGVATKRKGAPCELCGRVVGLGTKSREAPLQRSASFPYPGHEMTAVCVLCPHQQSTVVAHHVCHTSVHLHFRTLNRCKSIELDRRRAMVSSPSLAILHLTSLLHTAQWRAACGDYRKTQNVNLKRRDGRPFFFLGEKGRKGGTSHWFFVLAILASGRRSRR